MALQPPFEKYFGDLYMYNSTYIVSRLFSGGLQQLSCFYSPTGAVL